MGSRTPGSGDAMSQTAATAERARAGDQSPETGDHVAVGGAEDAGTPAVLKRAFETGGSSLVTGVRQLVDDLRHNGGLPSQVDRSAFTVGENLALSPGVVVYRDEVCEVIQYTPTTPQVRARPVVMVPPQINKFYFMDLAPQRSFIEYAVSKGLTFFAVSWRNPVASQGSWNLDTYGERVVAAIDAAREITGSDSVNVIGMCAGGITASAGL